MEHSPNMKKSLNMKKSRSYTPLILALKPLIFELNDSAQALVPRTAAISVHCLQYPVYAMSFWLSLDMRDSVSLHTSSRKSNMPSGRKQKTHIISDTGLCRWAKFQLIFNAY